MPRPIRFTLNGRPAQVETSGERMLLWVLRSDLGLVGTKFGCGISRCGACTVLVDGVAVRSCATPLSAVAGKRVLTIEGLERGGVLHPLQQAFLARHAFQCGYCTSGMVLEVWALLLEEKRPSRERILRQLDGHLCRCGAHHRILEAVEEAAAAISGGGR